MDVPIFVDREEELHLLIGIFKSIVVEGRSSCAVVIHGQEGSGRTALVQEAIRRIGEDPDVLMQTRSFTAAENAISVDLHESETRRPEPFAAFDAVRDRFRKRSLLLRMAQRAGESLLKLLPGGEFFKDVVEIAREIGSTGGTATEQRQRVRQFMDYTYQLRRQTEKHPLVFHISGAEWMDPDSFDLLKYLVTRERWVSTLFILEFADGTHLPAAAHTLARTRETQKKLFHIRLRPLERASLRILMNAALGGEVFADDDVLGQALRLTRGLPGEALRLLDRLKHEGLLVHSGKVWQLREPEFIRQMNTPEEQYLGMVREYLADDDQIDEKEAEKLRGLAQHLSIDRQITREVIELGYLEKRAHLHVRSLVHASAFRRTYLAADADGTAELFVDVFRGLTIRAGRPQASSQPSAGWVTSARSVDVAEDLVMVVEEGTAGSNLLDRMLGPGLGVVASLRVVREIAQAFIRSSEQGTAHGFLRPEMITINEQGNVIVSGFGLALDDHRKLHGHTDARNVTAYMAPEVVDGRSPDIPANIFTLGVILFELVAGVSPLQRITDARRAVTDNLASVLDLEWMPPVLRRIIVKSLDRDPGNRYPSMKEFIADIGLALDEHGDETQLPAVPVRAPRPRAGRFAAIGAGVVLFIIAAAVLIPRLLTSHPALHITTAPLLPTAVVNTEYRQMLLATDGIERVEWSAVSGVLPTGISLSKEGILIGVPVSRGTYYFSVQALAPDQEPVEKGFSLSVGDAGLVLDVPSVISDAMAGQRFTLQLGSVPPARWTLREGALPAGLVLSESGLLSGTPSVPGNFRVMVEGKDATGGSATKAIEIIVIPVGLAVTTAPNLGGAIVGSPYVAHLSASGASGSIRWTQLRGELPPGLTIHQDGKVEGIPSRSGKYAFTVQVSDASDQSAMREMILVVEGPSAAIATASPLPIGRVGSAYRQTFSLTSGTAEGKWSVAGGTLPAGLAMQSGGQLEGTPVSSGTYAFTVLRQADRGKSATKQFDLVIQPPPYDLHVDQQPSVMIVIDPQLPANPVRQDVRVNVLVGIDGKVRKAETISIDRQEYEEPAQDAARRYVFTPALVNGQPVESWKTITVKFRP
jgi:hypothetical protein